MTVVQTKTYCVSCDYPLTVHDEDHYYTIRTPEGDVVTSCPNCLVPLQLEAGVLVLDEARAG